MLENAAEMHDNKRTTPVLEAPTSPSPVPVVRGDHDMAVQQHSKSSPIYSIEQATVFRAGTRRFLTRSAAVKTYALRKIRGKHGCECEPADYPNYSGHDCGCSVLREKVLPRYLRMLKRAERGSVAIAVAVPEVYEVRYPFVRDVYAQWDSDESGSGCVDVPTWKPGVRNEDVYPDDCIAVADGEGLMRLTVISRHRPSEKYRERVFYTREWVDPDGHAFGKKALRMLGAQAFKRIASGFRVEYEIAKPKSVEEAGTR